MGERVPKLVKKIQAMNPSEKALLIQAMGDEIEGVNYPAALSSLLDGDRITSIPGTTNAYKSYSSQVNHTYKKYNGEEDYGNNLVRAIVDIRASFISGEGLTITSQDKAPEKFTDFITNFVEENKLNSTKLFAMAKTAEMCGYVIPFIKKAKDQTPRLCILTNNRGKTVFYPKLSNPYDTSSITGVMAKKEEGSEPVGVHNFAFIVTGGDGTSVTDLTTKVGVVLQECDSYDRAIKEMRELNYKMARITPSFETKNKSETDQVANWITKNNWNIGKAFVGTAKLTYQVPGTGAHTNLNTELSASVKSISGTTSVPVHWLGHVDLMSNRATADELYNMINNGTVMERLALADGMKQIILEAQAMYIDEGGDLDEVYRDFTVNIPLIDFNRFESMVKAYSLLHADDIISKKTYRGIVPNVDALQEEEQIQAERDAEEPEEEPAEKLGIDPNLIVEEEIPMEDE